jgi:hypothetical protein
VISDADFAELLQTRAEDARGPVAGRPLLYPADGDVTAALDRAALLLKGER